MDLLEQLHNDTLLSRYICDKCEENNIGVLFDEESHHIILNPESYYKNQHLGKTINMIDCFIVQRCRDNRYKVILIELKNIDSSKRIDDEARTDIIQKFNSCLNDFMLRDFKQYFDRHYTLKLYFISKLSMSAAYSKLTKDIDRNSRLRNLMTQTFSFRNKIYLIEAQPNNFAIQPC